MNAQLTKSLDKAAMAVGFVLFFGIMISVELRNGLGVATGYVVGWLPTFCLSMSCSSFWLPLRAYTPA